MRSVVTMICISMASVMTGCVGGANSTPTAITQDEQRQMDEAQARAKAEEATHRKSAK
jgi:hypothetical protein